MNRLSLPTAAERVGQIQARLERAGGVLPYVSREKAVLTQRVYDKAVADLMEARAGYRTLREASVDLPEGLDSALKAGLDEELAMVDGVLAGLRPGALTSKAGETVRQASWRAGKLTTALKGGLDPGPSAIGRRINDVMAHGTHLGRLAAAEGLHADRVASLRALDDWSYLHLSMSVFDEPRQLDHAVNRIERIRGSADRRQVADDIARARGVVKGLLDQEIGRATEGLQFARDDVATAPAGEALSVAEHQRDYWQHRLSEALTKAEKYADPK